MSEFIVIPFHDSTQISETKYRNIATDNDETLGKIFKVKMYKTNTETDGYISLVNDIDDGRFLRLPLKKQDTSDIGAYDNVMFLDNSGTLSIKVDGITKSLEHVPAFPTIPEVSSLPSPSVFPTSSTTIVSHTGVLKWYDTANATWKTITSV